MRLTFTEKSLNEPTVGTAVASADIKGFPYCHSGDDRVEQEWGDLGFI